HCMGCPYGGTEILGIVPDFTYTAVENAIRPTIYFLLTYANSITYTQIKLAPDNVVETVAAIESVWRKMGGQGTMRRFFDDEFFQEVYTSVERQAEAFAYLAGIAVFLAS